MDLENEYLKVKMGSLQLFNVIHFRLVVCTFSVVYTVVYCKFLLSDTQYRLSDLIFRSETLMNLCYPDVGLTLYLFNLLVTETEN